MVIHDHHSSKRTKGQFKLTRFRSGRSLLVSEGG